MHLLFSPTVAFFAIVRVIIYAMELDFINEWTDGIPTFSTYTIIDISGETINLTSYRQNSFSFVILGLGFRIFWNT